MNAETGGIAENAETAETTESTKTAENTGTAGIVESVESTETAEDAETREDTKTAGKPVVRRREQVPLRALAPGVTVAEMLNDEHGCRGLHQRRLRLAGTDALGRTAALAGNVMLAGDAMIAGDATLAGTAEGRGEAWYVIRGSGILDAGQAGSAELLRGTAVWLRASLGYRCQGNLEILAVTVQADAGEDQTGSALRVTTLDACPVERTGNREFRVLLSAGLPITQFAGLIPPGRAPEHKHTYDEVVHVLAGLGMVHLEGKHTEIGPGTSIYLPPQVPHCLENTSSEPLRVLGVFYPAGSPAANQTT